MQPNKTLFFVIIGAAIVAVAGMAVVGYFLTGSTAFTPVTNTIEIEVVVAPSVKSWAEDAARNFNQANPNAQVSIVTANDLLPETEFQTANSQTPPPAAWLAEASFVVEMAANAGLPFEDAQSVAGTSLAWGIYNSKLEQFNQDYGSLSWENLHAKGTNNNDVLKLVIESPQTSAEGLAALASAAAAHLNTDTLTANDISAADQWLSETFGERNTQIPATPAGDFATKGVSAGDVGILRMASWRNVNLDQKPDTFTLTPTQPEVVLDYPLAIFSGSQPEAKAAAQAFRRFLLEEAQQKALAEISLDAAGANTGGVQLDGTAAQRLQDWANRRLR